MQAARLDASVERYTETMFGSLCPSTAEISDMGTPARSMQDAALCRVILLPLTRPFFCIPAMFSIFCKIGHTAPAYSFLNGAKLLRNTCVSSILGRSSIM